MHQCKYPTKPVLRLLNFWWSAIASDCSSQVLNAVSGTTGRNLNQWYQVTLSRNGTANTTTFYVNGKIDGAVDTQQLCTSVTNNMTVGEQSSKYYTFIGNIDSVRIYSQALSSADVERLYAEGIAKHNIAKK